MLYPLSYEGAVRKLKRGGLFGPNPRPCADDLYQAVLARPHRVWSARRGNHRLHEGNRHACS